MRDGKQWPIGIIVSTMMIVTACVATVYVALLQPVQEDQDMMAGYHSLNADANKIITAGIKFNKKYQLTYTGEGVSLEGCTISYRLEDMKGKPVDDAVITVVLSRPITGDNQLILENPRIENGSYLFENVKVADKGRWNILAKITVGEDFRHMNLKSDTTDKDVYEYGLDKPMRNYAANGGRTL